MIKLTYRLYGEKGNKMIGKILLGVYLLTVLLSLFNFIAAFQDVGRLMKKRRIVHHKKTLSEKLVSTARMVLTVGFWSVVPLFNLIVSGYTVNMENITKILDQAESEHWYE